MRYALSFFVVKSSASSRVNLYFSGSAFLVMALPVPITPTLSFSDVRNIEAVFFFTTKWPSPWSLERSLKSCHFPFLLFSSRSATLLLNRFFRCLMRLRLVYRSSALSFGRIFRCSGMSTSSDTGMFSSFKDVEFRDGCALLSRKKYCDTISLFPVFLNFMWYPCSLIFSMKAPCHFPSVGFMA